MPAPTVIQGDLHVTGRTTSGSTVIPINSVTNPSITQPAPGGDFIDKDKIEQAIIVRLAQAHGTAATTERRPVHIAKGPGVLEAVDITAMVANIGAATITVAVMKNGATNCLSATLDLDNGDAAFDIVSGAINGAVNPYVAGDVFDVAITAAAGGGTLGQGTLVQLVFREDPL